MTAGAPLYLVSACASGEDFVAAFRRYADRNGVLFVPTAEPLSSGKRGRIAVTLKDGGVMLEGEAEVVSSSKSPSILYGRVGMTIRFTAPDELSKVVLGELEKARLALKPSAPSVMPRPAVLPSDKRPTPPAPGGRVDAVNALAECVILGELPDAVPAAVGGPGSGKFAVPQILPLGARPKTPTTPPSAAARPKKLTQPPVVAPINAPEESGRNKTASVPPPIPGLPGLSSTKATSLGMPALRTPAAAPPPAPAPAKPPTPAAGFPVTPSTIHGVSQSTRAPAAPAAVVEAPTAVGLVPTPPAPKFDMNETLRGTLPAPPIVAAARPALPEVEIGEPTDLNAMPPMLEGAPTEQTEAQREPRSTNVGVAVAPPRPLVIEEPTPSGDWTMIPGADGPTITPVTRPAAPPPKGPPTGDWLIALDPSRPDGWSEPSKVEKRPPGELPPGPPQTTVSSDKPLDSNANVPHHQQEVPQGGPSIEIDPSLTGPAMALTEPSAKPVPRGPFVAPLLTPTSTPAVQISPEQHMAMLGIAPAPVPPPRALTDAGTGFFRDSGDIPRYPTEPTTAIAAGSRKRTIVIAASAGAAVIVGLILVFTLGGDDKKADTTAGSAAAPVPSPTAQTPTPSPAPPPPPPPPPTPAMGSGSAVAIETPTAPTQETAPPAPEPTPEPAPEPKATVDAPPSSTDCAVKVSSTPAGADIFIANQPVGKTPTELTLPCGVETKLSLRRARYVNANVTVKPSAEKPRPVKVALAHVTMTVKVSSTPAGATITVGAKSMGVTPTTVKLPAFEASTLKISKPGFSVETHKVTPKQNNVSVHAVLKKTAKSKR